MSVYAVSPPAKKYSEPNGENENRNPVGKGPQVWRILAEKGSFFF
jgi:hypothetical protein